MSDRSFLWSGLVCLAVGTWEAFASVSRGNRRHLVGARICAGAGSLAFAAWLVAEGIRTAHFPVTGASEAFLFLSCLIMGSALALDGLKGWSILLVASLPLCTVTGLLAYALTFAPAGPPPQNLSSLWLGLHILTAVGAYAAFGMAFLSAVLFLVAQRQLKVHASGSVLGWMPPLETVGKLMRRSVAVGILLQLGGLLVGYLQARKVMGTGTDWRHDPKVWLTTLTLLAYVLVLAFSSRPGFKGRRAALATAAGFVLVMLTFWASVFWSGFHRFH